MPRRCTWKVTTALSAAAALPASSSSQASWWRSSGSTVAGGASVRGDGAAANGALGHLEILLITIVVR
jgi:hypothetical protein